MTKMKNEIDAKFLNSYGFDFVKIAKQKRIYTLSAFLWFFEKNEMLDRLFIYCEQNGIKDPNKFLEQQLQLLINGIRNEFRAKRWFETRPRYADAKIIDTTGNQSLDRKYKIDFILEYRNGDKIGYQVKPNNYLWYGNIQKKQQALELNDLMMESGEITEARLICIPYADQKKGFYPTEIKLNKFQDKYFSVNSTTGEIKKPNNGNFEWPEEFAEGEE